jgi:hypothetical protein
LNVSIDKNRSGSILGGSCTPNGIHPERFHFPKIGKNYRFLGEISQRSVTFSRILLQSLKSSRYRCNGKSRGSQKQVEISMEKGGQESVMETKKEPLKRNTGWERRNHKNEGE